jgi:hypothetical protein
VVKAQFVRDSQSLERDSRKIIPLNSSHLGTGVERAVQPRHTRADRVAPSSPRYSYAGEGHWVGLTCPQEDWANMESLPLHEQDSMFSISAAPARFVEGFGFGRLDLRMEFGRSILKVVVFFFVV